jgi:hypothetical protein
MFLFAGLLMLSGLIMFISIFKSEVYHKLHPSSREVTFGFNYGQSFILYVIGFVAVEFAGILNVCLFNKLQKAEEINQVTVSKDSIALSLSLLRTTNSNIKRKSSIWRPVKNLCKLNFLEIFKIHFCG